MFAAKDVISGSELARFKATQAAGLSSVNPFLKPDFTQFTAENQLSQVCTDVKNVNKVNTILFRGTNVASKVVRSFVTSSSTLAFVSCTEPSRCSRPLYSVCFLIANILHKKLRWLESQFSLKSNLNL
jgi:hypothetical protein